MKNRLLYYFLFFLIFNTIRTFQASKIDEEKIKRSWEKLFINYSKRGCKVLGNEIPNHKSDQIKKNLGLPVANQLTRDRFDIKMGRADVGYMFDFLDPVVKNDFFTTFKKIWVSAQSAIEDSNISDDYDLNKIMTKNFAKINFWLKSKPTEINSLEDPSTQETIRKKISKEFDLKVYENSINMKRLSSFLKNSKYNDLNAKDIIDRFDMDGDGRLNPREFILFTIIMIKSADNASIASYNTIVKNIINPMFKTIDCNNNNSITTQEIYDTLVLLKRPVNTYDMYSCKTGVNGLHSTSINEFVLKNNKSRDGKMKPDEFRRGILLGFWDRMTTKLDIIDSDELSELNLRWKNNGTIDKACEEMEEMMKLIN